MVKKFQEGTRRPSSRSSEALLPNLVQISFVLLSIEVFFSGSATYAFPVFPLTDLTARLPEAPTRKTK